MGNVDYTLGINTSFAVKRWPEPERWASLIQNWEVELVQHTFDLVDLDGSSDYSTFQADAVRDACKEHGLRLHSTFTGLAAYCSNLLLHPDERYRGQAEDWYRRAIDFTARAGASATGGHVGAFSVADRDASARQSSLLEGMNAALHRLASHAKQRGLQLLLVENMASAREPSTMDWMRRLMTPGDDREVPVALCLDVGHQCVPGTEGDERNPYAWLERLGALAPVIHLQQSDAEADHHWPFTQEANAKGRIRAERVLDALESSGATEVTLVLEVVPSFEEDDGSVLDGIAASVAYWKDALNHHA